MQQAAEPEAWGGVGDGAKDPPKRLGKRSLEGTVCSVAKRAQDLHALRHKASADYHDYADLTFQCTSSSLIFKERPMSA